MANGDGGFTKPQLTPEQASRLTDADGVLQAAKATLADLRDIGVDTSEVDAQVEQAERVSRGLRQRFAPTGGRRGRAKS